MVLRKRIATFTTKDIPSSDKFTAHGSEFVIPDRTVVGIPLRPRVNNREILRNDFRWSTIKTSLVTFWSKSVTRIWVFFVEALWIPGYRHEWGKYQTWTPNVDEDEDEGKRKRKKKRRRLTTLSSASVVTDDDEDLPETKESKMNQGLQKFIAEGKVNLHELDLHDPAGCEILRFNIAGLIYETQRRTLEEYPDTLLGDPKRRMRYWDPSREEYFFDRHRKSFEAILYYYQSRGTLLRPSDVSIPVFEDELKFYDLGPSVIFKLLQEEGVVNKDDIPKPLPKNLLLRKLWFLIEYPESSPQAKFTGIFSVFVVVLSTCSFCLETLPLFSEDQQRSRLKDPLSLTEAVCVIWFTFEFILRLISCPEKWKFVKTPLNFLDVLSILPFYISIFYGSSQGEEGGQSPAQALATFKVLRLFRVFRVFKLSRHSSGLRVLGKTLQASMRELQLLVFFLIVCVVVFSSLIYYAEISDPASQFKSIPDAFWWGVVTMTSLGYGDQVPKGVTGRLVCAVCAVAAVLALSLPIPVVVSNFNFYYQRETQEEVRKEMGGKLKHVHGCEFLPECPFLRGNEDPDQDDDEDDGKPAKEPETLDLKEAARERRRSRRRSTWFAPPPRHIREDRGSHDATQGSDDAKASEQKEPQSERTELSGTSTQLPNMPSQPARKLTQAPGKRRPSPGKRTLSPGKLTLSPSKLTLSPSKLTPSPGKGKQLQGKQTKSPGKR